MDRFSGGGSNLPEKLGQNQFVKGEPLFEIECEVQVAQRQIYSATLRQAELELQSREKLASYSAATELEVEQSRTAVERARAELQVYENILEQCRQTAPFDGIVVDQFIQDQEYAREGDPVLHLVDPNDIFFEFLAPATWIDEIEVNQTIYVWFEDRGASVALGVNRITPVIDAVGQTFRVYASVNKENFSWLRVGMVGKVALDMTR